ncbi:MAG: hypothetical protein Q4G66_07960 [bacterium]|nr:hypothetical protein [bacterium]
MVQFVGPDDHVRHAAAVGLVAQNLAPLLMIPATFHLSERNSQGELVQVPSKNIREIFPCEPWNDSKTSRLMEDTHKELLLAKCTMDRLQLDSAILVSSASHMRRIRLMADRVFEKSRYRIHCVAAEEGGKKLSWWPDNKDWWWLTREYPKILWFLLYAPFVQDKDDQFTSHAS